MASPKSRTWHHGRMVFGTGAVFVVLLGGCASGRATAPSPQCVIERSPGALELLGRYRNPPVLVPFGDGRHWYLASDFTWVPATASAVTVPKGFVTDFASIPRPLWVLLPKWDGYGAASVLHDYLYWSQHESRHTADLWMKEAMADMGVGTVKRGIIYAALRMFGGIAWNNNASKRRSCEVACLAAASFPDDATRSWTEVRQGLTPPDGCPPPWIP